MLFGTRQKSLWPWAMVGSHPWGPIEDLWTIIKSKSKQKQNYGTLKYFIFTSYHTTFRICLMTVTFLHVRWYSPLQCIRQGLCPSRLNILNSFLSSVRIKINCIFKETFVFQEKQEWTDSNRAGWIIWIDIVSIALLLCWHEYKRKPTLHEICNV